MPLDRMDLEAYPWPKRYNVTRVRLRQAFVSQYPAATATNRATHLLFNSSAGDRVIVVRAFTFNGATAASATPIGAQQGALGSHLGTETPLWRGEAIGVGQHFYVDTLTVLPNQQLITPAVSSNFLAALDLPWAVLPPGWAFYIQANAAALTLAASFQWEELAIDDPDLGSIGPR